MRATDVIVIALVCVCGIAAGTAIAQTTGEQTATDPVAVVTINGKEASINLVDRIASQLPEATRARGADAYYDDIIDHIIDTRITAEAARAAGLGDDPELAEIIGNEADRILAEAWITAEVRRRVTDEVISTRYENLKADTVSRIETRARHILVATKEEAEAVITRLEAGEDFAALAAEVSTGPSGANGGDLGYFRQDQMVPEFATAALIIKPGEFSVTPTRTEFGWHVIKVEDRRTAQMPPLDEIRQQLIAQLYDREASNIITRLRDEAVITGRLSLDEMRAATGR